RSFPPGPGVCESRLVAFPRTGPHPCGFWYNACNESVRAGRTCQMTLPVYSDWQWILDTLEGDSRTVFFRLNGERVPRTTFMDARIQFRESAGFVQVNLAVREVTRHPPVPLHRRPAGAP